MLLFNTKQGIGRASADSQERLEILIDEAKDLVPYLSPEKLGELKSTTPIRTIELSASEILPPVLKPGRLIIVGLNYKSHCDELGFPHPAQAMFFEAPSEAICNTGSDIPIPSDAPDQVDYEAEIAIVIGALASKVSKENAWSVIGGLAPINDVSARDVQSAMTLEALAQAKGFPRFKPFGPCLATVDEFPDPNNIGITTRVNGELRQNGRTNDMLFSIPEIIESVSANIDLQPGDVICTGTPSGAAVEGKYSYLKAGDSIELTVEGLPPLINKFVG
ncbi:MAG: fumarylacetoacetate hydrolase family protein [Parasphingorhabdus sp.]